MKNKFLSFFKRRLISYSLFLSVLSIDECSVLWCYLTPGCELPYIIGGTQEQKKKEMPTIPENTDFGIEIDTVSTPETEILENINNDEDLERNTVTLNPENSASESITDERDREGFPVGMDRLKKLANPAIPSIYAGFGPSFFSGKPLNGGRNSLLPGFEVGLRWSIPLNGHWQLEPSIQYRTIGNKIVQESIVDDPYYYHVYRFEEIVRLNYVDLQISLSYFLTPRFSIGGGTSISYLLGAKSKNISEHSSQKVRSTDGLNRVSLGANIHGMYHPANSFFGFGLIYDHGFNPINNDRSYSSDQSDRKYSNSVMMVVLYKLPLGNANYKINRRNHATALSPEEAKRRDAERKRKSEEQRKNPQSNSAADKPR